MFTLFPLIRQQLLPSRAPQLALPLPTVIDVYLSLSFARRPVLAYSGREVYQLALLSSRHDLESINRLYILGPNCALRAIFELKASLTSLMWCELAHHIKPPHKVSIGTLHFHIAGTRTRVDSYRRSFKECSNTDRCTEARKRRFPLRRYLKTS